MRTRALPAVGLGQVRKNTNHSTPRMRTASPVDTVRSANIDGPGSAWRASVGVSTVWPCRRVAMGDLVYVSACNVSYASTPPSRSQRPIVGDVPAFSRLRSPARLVQKVAAHEGQPEGTKGGTSTVNAVVRFPAHDV